MHQIAIVMTFCVGLGAALEARASNPNEQVTRLALPRIYYGLPPPSLAFIDLGVVAIPNGGESKNAAQAVLDKAAHSLGADAFIYETGSLADIYHTQAVDDSVERNLSIAAGMASLIGEIGGSSSGVFYAQGKPTGVDADYVNRSVPTVTRKGYFRAIKRCDPKTKPIESFAPAVSPPIQTELAHADTLQGQFTALTVAALAGNLPMPAYTSARASLAKAAGWSL
jgi:hypothetical protein